MERNGRGFGFVVSRTPVLYDPFKYRERLGPASPPQTLPQPLPQPLNRRNLRFGYKEDVFCPEGCKPKED